MQVISIKSNSSFQKKHTTTNSRASGNIFFLGCTQHHGGLHPARPVGHIGSQTQEATQGALLLSGAINMNQHNGASYSSNLYYTQAHTQLYPLGTSLHALQLGEHVLNPSETGSICSQQSKYLVSYLFGTSMT